MVVLNFYGTIAPICISKKLGLYISNLPNTKHNEWRDDLAEELELAVKADIIYQDKLGTNFPCGFQRLYHNLFPDVTPPSTFTKEHYLRVADKMICIYQEYSYEDKAIVEGEHAYEVEFDFADGEIRDLICSCPCGYTCKHEVAAMMQLKETLDLIEKQYADFYHGYFAAVVKGALFQFVIDRKDCGMFTL